MRKLTAIVIFALLLTAASGAVMADGASTYKEVCSSCHESGAADAPKLEDKAEWGHRIAQGADALYKSTINGKCDVYVKHLRTDLSDETIKTAVDYMISRAR
jgi:cytochrome c5